MNNTRARVPASRTVLRAGAGCLLVLAVAGGMWLRAATPSPIHEPAEGQKLAADLRQMAPAESAEFSAVMRLSAPGRDPVLLPVKSRVTVSGSNWVTTYEAAPVGGPAETLAIRRAPGQPPVYEWRRGPESRTLDGRSATNGFAGSDFALIDLGLEFFHWPTQAVVLREMRKGRGCDVLESRLSPPSLYGRVLSWIDQESRAQGQPGLLLAEGYDARGRILKEFEIRGFKKVAGRWQVREMEIRNRQAKTSTRLQFEFPEE